METGTSSALQARARYRHELRTLTYVTLDQANGGIVRNLTHEGIAVQAVAAVRPKQQLRVRFELRYPRLRVEARGEVVWSTFSGQCGIRFLDLPARLARQIDEWIFGDLLEGGGLTSNPVESVLLGFARAASARSAVPPLERSAIAEQPVGVGPNFLEEVGPRAVPPRVGGAYEAGDDGIPDGDQDEEKVAAAAEVEGGIGNDGGLVFSPGQEKAIALPAPPPTEPPRPLIHAIAASAATRASRNGGAPTGPISAPASPVRDHLDWLSQPLTGRSLAWTVDALVVLASALLGIFVFLSVTREAPQWPLALAAGGALVVTGLYWGFFKLFGGASFGARLARLVEEDVASNRESQARFR